MQLSLPARRLARRLSSLCLVAALALGAPGLSLAGPYATEASGIRWNEVGGIRWNEVGGPLWTDLQGIRWNEVGGIRWNEVGGPLITEATGIRWNEVGGIRWNEVGSLEFDNPTDTGPASVGLDLLATLDALPDTSAIDVVITYRQMPDQSDLDDLNMIGIAGGMIFRRLPMVVVHATKPQVAQIAAFPEVRSVYANRTLSFFDQQSGDLIGLDQLASDAELQPEGLPLTGAGVTIAVLDTGVDGTHPDLPFGSKLLQNVRLTGELTGAAGFTYPRTVEDVSNTDSVSGHGTFVASVAAGSGAGSGGLYTGVAPGASLLGLSAGDLLILNVLEGFDYILDHREEYGVRVVNCSWGTQGWFDPDDPVNVATRLLWEAGVTPVFAAGNHGPAPDSLNPYAVAPWVVGVGSTDKAGRLSRFSSRGVFEELLYHPTLTAPGEGIVAASAGLVAAVDGIAGILDPTLGLTVPAPHDGDYTVSSGTSFAAPHVAGVIALMLEADPALDPATIRRVLQQTATPSVLHDRSQIGAGRLDGWAAVAAVVDPGRRFGAHVPARLDERPYRIDHRLEAQQELTVPARGTLSVPAAPGPGARSFTVSVAWDGVPGVADVDLRLLDASGSELARSTTLNGHGLFGRVEGISLIHDVPATLTVELFFKPGTGLVDQDVSIRMETATATITAWDDVHDLPPDEAQIVLRAASLDLVAGRGESFEPGSWLTRGELARAVALIGGAEQRVPGRRSYHDVSAAHPDFPWVEAVAGERSRRLLMERLGPASFRPSTRVRRLDFAAALVRAAGLEQAAAKLSGTSLGLADDGLIPDRLRGHASLALALGLIEPVDGAFDPTGKVTRLEAAGRLLELYGVLRAEADADVPPETTGGGEAAEPARRDRPALDVRQGLAPAAGFSDRRPPAAAPRPTSHGPAFPRRRPPSR